MKDIALLWMFLNTLFGCVAFLYVVIGIPILVSCYSVTLFTAASYFIMVVAGIGVSCGLNLIFACLAYGCRM